MYISDDSAEFSLSEDFDPDISDFEDPVHDQEILDLLFYKNSTSSKKQVINTEGHCPLSKNDQWKSENMWMGQILRILSIL